MDWSGDRVVRVHESGEAGHPWRRGRGGEWEGRTGVDGGFSLLCRDVLLLLDVDRDRDSVSLRLLFLSDHSAHPAPPESSPGRGDLHDATPASPQCTWVHCGED